MRSSSSREVMCSDMGSDPLVFSLRPYGSGSARPKRVGSVTALF